MVRTRKSPQLKQAKQTPLLRFVKSNRFLRDCQHAYDAGRHAAALAEMWALLELLRRRDPIPPQYRCHALKGDWIGWNDCHTEGDFVLIWRYDRIKNEDVVLLAACGTHAYLFG